MRFWPKGAHDNEAFKYVTSVECGMYKFDVYVGTGKGYDGISMQCGREVSDYYSSSYFYHEYTPRSEPSCIMYAFAHAYGLVKHLI